MRDQPWTNGCERNDVSLRRLELQSEKRVNLNRKTRLKKATNCADASESERGEYLRLRARLGTAGLASGLASSHFGWM